MLLFDRFKQMFIPGKKQNWERMDMAKDDKEEHVARLTPREHDLYLLLLEGFTLKKSAKQLSIKYSPANTHMTAIYKKLGVKSRAELMINYRDIAEKNTPHT